MNKIKVASLFSGIGGFETGVFNAFGRENVEVVFASEIDKYASQSYETLYGHKPHGDITKIDAVEIPDHDVMVCGFPCQSFSIAGKREGFLDKTRGTLFFEIMRIAKVKKPKVMVLENVKGLVNHDKGNTLETIALALNEAGYTFDMQILNSKYFNVPQNRERIFFVCVLNADTQKWAVTGKDTLSKAKKSLMDKHPGLKTFNFTYPKQETVSKRLKDILEKSVDEKYYLSEEKTKKLVLKVKSEDRKKVEVSEESIVQLNGDRTNPGLSVNDTAYTIASNPMSDRGQLVVEPQVDVVGNLDIAGNDSIKRVYSEDGISPTLTTMEGGLREPKIIVEGQVNEGQSGIIYSEDGLSPTLDTCQGGNRMPKIITHEFQEVVRIRKYEVDTEKLKKLLKEKKVESGFSITAISKALNKPKTLVEHWFRTDIYFAIPDADIWYSLKKLLGINTDDFDLSITEFIEKEGEFEKSGRIYDPEGIAPTLTSTSADEKIIEPSIEQIGYIETNSEGYRVYDEEGISPTLTRQKGGLSGSGGLITEEVKIEKLGNIYPSSEYNAAQSGIIYADNGLAPTISIDHPPKILNTYRIRKLTPLECFRLQNFPDEYYFKLVEAGISNSQLYKQAGNAVTCSVIEAIFKGLVSYFE